jgi:phosphoribosylamine-glycine ligase
MRFNFVSSNGDGLGLATRVQDEGNSVRLWIDEDAASAVGDGLVPKVEDLEDLVRDAKPGSDIFVFDSSGHGFAADALARQGFPVVGGSILADRLEKDRRFAREVMGEVGIETPPSMTFTGWDEAIEFARTVEDRMVYKPSKRLGEESPSLVTHDQEDLIELLENLKGRIHMADIQFDLQTFVEGLEISTEGWFDGHGWLPLFNHTFERKQLMPGNLGPSGGCSGNVVWACDGQCSICKAGIKKMEKFLRSKGYRGPIDINSIVNEENFFGLEFTPRFGYDASPTLAYELLDMEIGQFLADVGMDRYIPDTALIHDRFAAGVKITIPPWPTEKHHAEAGVPIRGFDPGDNIYWYNVAKMDNRLYSAGAWGIIGLTLGSGNSIKSSFRRAYEIAERLRIQDKQYRNDLADEFKISLSELEEFSDVSLFEEG